VIYRKGKPVSLYFQRPQDTTGMCAMYLKKI